MKWLLVSTIIITLVQVAWSVWKILVLYIHAPTWFARPNPIFKEIFFQDLDNFKRLQKAYYLSDEKRQKPFCSSRNLSLLYSKDVSKIIQLKNRVSSKTVTSKIIKNRVHRVMERDIEKTRCMKCFLEIGFGPVNHVGTRMQKIRIFKNGHATPY